MPHFARRNFRQKDHKYILCYENWNDFEIEIDTEYGRIGNRQAFYDLIYVT